MLFSNHNGEATKKFFCKILGGKHRIINVNTDKTICPSVFRELIRIAIGFKSFLTAKHTFQGYETMHMIKKG